LAVLVRFSPADSSLDIGSGSGGCGIFVVVSPAVLAKKTKLRERLQGFSWHPGLLNGSASRALREPRSLVNYGGLLRFVSVVEWHTAAPHLVPRRKTAWHSAFAHLLAADQIASLSSTRPLGLAAKGAFAALCKIFS